MMVANPVARPFQCQECMGWVPDAAHHHCWEECQVYKKVRAIEAELADIKNDWLELAKIEARKTVRAEKAEAELARTKERMQIAWRVTAAWSKYAQSLQAGRTHVREALDATLAETRRLLTELGGRDQKAEAHVRELEAAIVHPLPQEWDASKMVWRVGRWWPSQEAFEAREKEESKWESK